MLQGPVILLQQVAASALSMYTLSALGHISPKLSELTMSIYTTPKTVNRCALFTE